MQKKKVLTIFQRFAAAEPHPRTELEFTNEFTLLVAIVLSAQATDVSVNKATRALFKTADTPQKMMRMGEARLKKYISSIGLYNAKAKNVVALSQMLIEQHGGEVPASREALENLPGVGRKTANVWLNCARGEPTIAVDTHVHRVSNRIGLVQAETPLEVEMQLEDTVPAAFKQHAHHWLILHGRYVCKARKPECPRCLIRYVCEYPFKTTEKDFPKGYFLKLEDVV